MSLIVDGGPGFQWCMDNLPATPATVGPGTTFSSGASNADGAVSAVLAALTYEAQYIVIKTGIDNTAGEDNSCLADIMFDPAGGTAWVEGISDLIVGSSQVAAAGALSGPEYHFNLRIAAGTSIGIQCRKTGATADTGARIAMWVYGQPLRPWLWKAGQAVESLGIDAANSKGTAHTPGATGTYSAYATIGTSTRRYCGLQVGVQMSGGTTIARAYHGQIGISDARMPGTGTFAWEATTAELGNRCQPGLILADVPSGTALQFRATSSGTADAVNVAYYGVY